VKIVPKGRRTLMRLLQERGVRIESDCGGAGTCGKCKVRIAGDDGTRTVLACQYVPKAAVTVSDAGLTTRNTKTLRVARKQAGAQRRLVADIGTTTVSLAVIDTARRPVMAKRDVLNPQTEFGADVMSRIAQAARVKKAGLHEMIAVFAAEQGVSRGKEVIAVGNTVMAHFLLGKSPSSLGEYPYRSRLPLKKTLTAEVGGLRLRMLPLLGSFVGSDCTAAILASGMWRSRRLGLLVDAGTNGEVVLGNRDRMLVCSTAAGPAFEGATLECGSLAQPGAVRAVDVRRGKLVLSVAGRGEARSICGSGVVDAVAAGLKLGVIDCSGRVSGGHLVLGRDLHLSQDDVRAVQLAKGAIVAAIRLLLDTWGARPADIGRLYVTGKFGAAMNPRSAMEIGLLPTVPLERVRQHGNLALLGAVRAALDPSLLSTCERIAGQCEELQLASDPRFETAFAEGMSLEPWS
jgi:uncharacterized 2Fe-2S/4Fe-4S cluster protein (DUF4445 family)